MNPARHNATPPARSPAGGWPCRPSEVTPELVEALIREARRRRSEYIVRGLARAWRAMAGAFRRPRRSVAGTHGRGRPTQAG